MPCAARYALSAAADDDAQTWQFTAMGVARAEDLERTANNNQ